MLFEKGPQEGHTRNKIVEHVINLIFNGALKQGDCLPSIRNISKRYGISRSTVVTAYKDLESLGYIQGKERSCYIVKRKPMRPLGESVTPDAPGPEHVSSDDTDPQFQLLEIATRLNSYDTATLSHHFIRKWSNDLNGNSERSQRLNGAREIHAELKTNLTRYLKITRGISSQPENMLVMPSQLEALTIIAHYGKLKKAPPSIILEDPCSPHVYHLFASLGYEIINVPVGEHGLDAASLPARAVDFIYTVPANNFPSGAQMSRHNRERLLEWSQAHNVIIIEDDACFMPGYEQEIIPPLHNTYPATNIIYLHPLHELMGNSVNLSLILFPCHLKQQLRQLSFMSINEKPTISNQLANAFLGSNYLMKYLEKTHQSRREKLQLALEGLMQYDPQLDHRGLTHSAFFSFALKEGSLPADLVRTTFFPLQMFCRNHIPEENAPRYVYPVGALTVNEIMKINARLAEHAGRDPL